MVLELSSFPLRPVARELALLGIYVGEAELIPFIDLDQQTRGVEECESLQNLHSLHSLWRKGDPRADVREAPSMWSVYTVVM